MQPYFFGTDDDGVPSKKTTRLTIRGWPLLKATDLIPGEHADRKHALKIFDPRTRSNERSAFTWNFAKALADQLNPSTVIPNSWQPDLAAELNILDTKYVEKYGADSLPLGHGNMQGLFPPDLHFPDHREQIRLEAIAASQRPTPQWPPTLFAKHVPAGMSSMEYGLKMKCNLEGKRVRFADQCQEHGAARRHEKEGVAMGAHAPTAEVRNAPTITRPVMAYIA